MAAALVESLLGEEAKILETFPGSALEHKEYEPLFSFEKTDKKAWYITTDSYVTLSEGSGIVHIAPAFGEDDARVGNHYGLPFVQLVGDDGTFDERDALAGRVCKGRG